MNAKGFSEAADDPSAWTVPELLIRFIRATNELNHCEPRHGKGLSAQQIRALLYLVAHDGATVKDLAHALSVSEARASRLADELVETGQVLHQRDVADRRLVRLHVAPAAKETAQRMYRERSGALKAALAGASEEELEILTRLLARIVEEFEALALRSAIPRPLVTNIHGTAVGASHPAAQSDPGERSTRSALRSNPDGR